MAIVPSRGQLKLLGRNGHDRTPLFRDPFRKLASSHRRMRVSSSRPHMQSTTAAEPM